jgi:hypothetical protein
MLACGMIECDAEGAQTFCLLQRFGYIESGSDKVARPLGAANGPSSLPCHGMIGARYALERGEPEVKTTAAPVPVTVAVASKVNGASLVYLGD